MTTTPAATTATTITAYCQPILEVDESGAASVPAGVGADSTVGALVRGGAGLTVDGLMGVGVGLTAGTLVDVGEGVCSASCGTSPGAVAKV